MRTHNEFNGNEWFDHTRWGEIKQERILRTDRSKDASVIKETKVESWGRDTTEKTICMMARWEHFYMIAFIYLLSKLLQAMSFFHLWFGEIDSPRYQISSPIQLTKSLWWALLPFLSSNSYSHLPLFFALFLRDQKTAYNPLYRINLKNQNYNHIAISVLSSQNSSFL